MLWHINSTRAERSQLKTLTRLNRKYVASKDRLQLPKILRSTKFDQPAKTKKEKIMRKQLAKGFTMLMLVVSLALVTAVVSANGQSRKSRTSVPFDFMVGDKALPAGNYNVDSITSSGDALRIGNADSAQSATRLTVVADGRSKTAKLVFHRYGERYFLAQVWTAGGAEGRQLMKSRQERAIEKENARIASLTGHTPEPSYKTVEIATTLN